MYRRGLSQLKLACKVALGYRVRRAYDNPRIRHDLRCIFVHIPKTAGNSITAALNSVPGKAEELSPKIAKHAKAFEIRALLGATVWDEYFTFSFVRNPWDLMVSSYHWWLQKAPSIPYHRRHAERVRRLGSFDAFLASPYGSSRINERRGNLFDWLSDGNGSLLVDYVGRVETIAEDWERIRERIDAPLPPLPHVNKSIRADYRDYYTPHTRDLIAKRFRRSIEAFGYEF